MKKLLLATLALLAVFAVVVRFPREEVNAVEKPSVAEAVYILPSGLLEIEEEAFADTAVQTVIFPEGFLKLDENVFKGAVSLKNIYIPASTEFIAESAFPADAVFAIHGDEKSYARQWAEKHRIAFVNDDVLDQSPGRKKMVALREIGDGVRSTAVNLQKDGATGRRIERESVNNRPLIRAELCPIDYRFP